SSPSSIHFLICCTLGWRPAYRSFLYSLASIRRGRSTVTFAITLAMVKPPGLQVYAQNGGCGWGSGLGAISALLVSLQHVATKCAFAHFLHGQVQVRKRSPQRLQRRCLLLQPLAQLLVSGLQLRDLRAVCEEI